MQEAHFCTDAFSIFVMDSRLGRDHVAVVKRISSTMLISLSVMVDEAVEFLGKPQVVRNTSATSAKRSKDVRKPKRDGVSDSGYSSRTAATRGYSSLASRSRPASKNVGIPKEQFLSESQRSDKPAQNPPSLSTYNQGPDQSGSEDEMERQHDLKTVQKERSELGSQ